ncbi:uncharacterized protein LOC125808494 [Solanum verrucosum]|uniref:uncharacterized protein LOC125808494 n=1 Tax=Solanum verrucosum TaxID=315347 RepID=UPI001E8A1CD0|nr:uncharacterized protein LOC125808494 [Solanum verrucosum]KAH0689481.1 hypothetical protein KY289_016839 [Solanum tuberosum]
MRIRKHAKIPLVNNRVCQLNQSPWDVITFPNEDPSLFQPPLPSSSNYQFVGSVDNGTFNDTDETFASVGEDVDVDVSFAAKIINQDKDDDIEMKELGFLMDKNNNGNKKQEKQHDVVVAKTGSLRRLPTRAKKSSYSSSNTNDFYYYSGFGPLWGKKRGASRKTIHPATSITGNNSTKNAEQCSSSQMDNEEINYVELEDEDDHHEEQNGKKKKKKRSLEAN